MWCDVDVMWCDVTWQWAVTVELAWIPVYFDTGFNKEIDPKLTDYNWLIKTFMSVLFLQIGLFCRNI